MRKDFAQPRQNQGEAEFRAASYAILSVVESAGSHTPRTGLNSRCKKFHCGAKTACGSPDLRRPVLRRTP